MRVKKGDLISIEGTNYRVGDNSATAINIWLELFEIGEKDDVGANIHLYAENSRDGECFSPSKIREALERAERAEWNKSPHGL